MNEFFTWQTIGTYAGSVALTAVITQAFKEVGFLKKVPTQLFSYVVAAVLLLLSQLFTAEFTLSSAALCLVNAVVVSLAANGSHAVAKKALAAVTAKTEDDDF